MRVGIICEGITDFVILEAIVYAVIDADDCALLQPDFDRLQLRDAEQRLAPGWQGVRKFLSESAPALKVSVYDVLLIQVDASIRYLQEIQRRLSTPVDPSDDLQPLRDLVKGWAGRELPESAVVTLPREDLEAWLLASHTNRKGIEGILSPGTVLVELGVLQEKNGKPHKTEEKYRELAPALARLVKNHRKLREVRELERTTDGLRRRARAVRRAGGNNR